MDLEILDWGQLGYQEALKRQRALVEERIAGAAPDRLIVVEHPPVVTLGRSGSKQDLCLSESALQQKGIEVFTVDRGGQATYHCPGQLVAYSIIKLADKDLHGYLRSLLAVVAAVVRSYGLQPVFKDHRPGIWVDSGKIASVGIAVKKWVTYHGVAFNVNNDLNGFNWIVPCGRPGEKITSLRRCLKQNIQLHEVKERFVHEFCRIFDARPDFGLSSRTAKYPKWLVRPAPDEAAIDQMEDLLGELNLATVCQSARCPNLGECFQRGTATFMILGDRCTRTCRFCAVGKGRPHKVDPFEPERIVRAVQLLNLRHVVVTSVTRDDLADGGAGHFCRTINLLRARCRGAKIEVLIPDFGGSIQALQQVCDARPDVLNHNVETVARLYPVVRPGAQYRRSLGILEYTARQNLPVKSGLMLGLGETSGEICATLCDLRQAGCRYLTLGQYLAPSRGHQPVSRFLTSAEFDRWAAFAHQKGFVAVASGPLVRSSYCAAEMLRKSACREDLNHGRKTQTLHR
ncbi:MAG: lipoyl synthase [Desulfobacterales bacterium]